MRLVPRRTAVGIIALLSLSAPAALPATASPPAPDDVIILEGATSTEGIAAGKGTTFYAGDRLKGDIYRGDIRTGTAGVFIDAPEGRAAIGMKADVKRDLLFVAGGATGDAYVYNTETKEALAPIELTNQAEPFINDVALTREGAWFTNSRAAELYFLPVSKKGELGQVKTLTLTGPAAAPWSGIGPNGIAATKGGNVLIVAHSAFGALFTVGASDGSTARIEGFDLPNVDGILVQGRQVWAVQNRLNQIVRGKLAPDLSSGTVQDVITSPAFNVPTTIAKFGNTLAAVNAKFGVEPTPTVYEVVLVPARG